MKLRELVSFGERLSRDLDAASERYNVKSDQRDILTYEVITVNAYLALLTRGVPVPQDRRESVLLGDWARPFEWDPELLQRTSEFYRRLAEYHLGSAHRNH